MKPTISSSMSTHAWGMLLVLSLVWGGSFFFNGILVKELPPIIIVFFRVLLAALFLWVYIYIKKIAVPTSTTAWGAFLIMGLLNNVIPFGLIVWGQTIISSSLASILNATVPMFTVVLAAMLLHDEKITRLKAIGVITGFIGTILIIGPDLKEFNEGPLLAQLAILLAAISYSFAGIFSRRFSRMGINPIATAAGQLTASTCIALPITVAMLEKTHWQFLPSSTTILSMIALALLSTAFAYILYFKIVAVAGATNISLVTFLIPIWASLLGVWFLSESFAVEKIVGIVIVAIGLSLIDGRIWTKLLLIK